jgi:hypothetical protein
MVPHSFKLMCDTAASAQETLEHVRPLVTGDMRVVEPWGTSLQITPEQKLRSREDVVGPEMKICTVEKGKSPPTSRDHRCRQKVTICAYLNVVKAIFCRELTFLVDFPRFRGRGVRVFGRREVT